MKSFKHTARAAPLAIIGITAIIASILAAACSSSKAAIVPEDEMGAVAKASALDAPPAAVRIPDAPGLNVEDLAARLRDAVATTSGVDVVDELSVRSELAACTEAPCPDAVASKYAEAQFIVASTVSKVGAVFLATVRIQRGAEELARTAGQAEDARVALTTAGREAGVRLRAKLIEQGVAERVDAPDEESGTVVESGAER